MSEELIKNAPKEVEQNQQLNTIAQQDESERKDKKPGVLAGFLQFFYGNFVVLILGFVSLPLMTRVLSTEEYGRTSLYSSVVSIIYIFAILGLDQAYIRYFYKENVDTRKLFKQCLYMPLILIAVLSGIYFVFSNFFNDILFERRGLDISILVVTYTLTSVFERFLFLNIRMEQRGKLYSNLNILSKVLYIVFALTFVLIYGDDFRVGLYALTLPLVIVTGGLLIRFILQKKSHTPVNHKVTTKELLTYGVPFVPMLLMEWLLSSMDKWSIRIFNDFAETGVYSAAMQIMTILLTFKITYVAFWSPIAMEKYEKESENVVKPFFADMFQKVQFLCMGAVFGLTMCRQIIVLVFGPSYREAVKIIPFLSLMPILSILFEMTGQGVKFKGKIVYFNYASLAAIICNLLGNTLLVPSLKGVGAAIATAITYIVYFVIGTFFANKCYKVDYKYTRFIVALVAYIGYATFATFTSNEIYNVCVGLVLIILLCLLNLQTVKDLLAFVFAFLGKLKAKK